MASLTTSQKSSSAHRQWPPRSQSLFPKGSYLSSSFVYLSSVFDLWFTFPFGRCHAQRWQCQPRALKSGGWRSRFGIGESVDALVMHKVARQGAGVQMQGNVLAPWRMMAFRGQTRGHLDTWAGQQWSEDRKEIGELRERSQRTLSAQWGTAVVGGTGSCQGEGRGECLAEFSQRRGRTVITLWEAVGEQVIHQICLPIY